MAAIGPYWKQPNYVPLIKMKNPLFINLELDALASFTKPLVEWADVWYCGNFPCTGLQNTVVLIEGGQVGGTSDTLPSNGDFTILSDNSDYANFETHVGDSIGKCSYKSKWGAYSCTGDNAGLLLIENLDEDALDRAIHPIFVKNEDIKRNEISFNNTINAFLNNQTKDGI